MRYNKNMNMFNKLSTPYQPALTGLPPLNSISRPQNRAQSLKLSQSGEEKPGIEVYTTYGNDQLLHVKGRVLEQEHYGQASAQDSKWVNLIRNLRFLKAEEIKHVPVEISVAGRQVKAQTDSDGLFDVTIGGFSGLTPGFHDVQVRLLSGPQVQAEARGTVVVQAQSDRSFGVVSDIDDTIQYSHVTHKMQALKTLLMGNEETLIAVPGMAALYRELEMASDGKVDGDIHYLSGSPINFSGRINRFLDEQKFPFGTVELKNMGLGKGQDSPFKQTDYKLEHLRKLFQTYPNKSFLLFGDSGESDPEIYRQIAQEFPQQVQGIYIHNITHEATNTGRFQGMTVIGSGLDAARDLYQKGVISQAALERVSHDSLRPLNLEPPH